MTSGWHVSSCWEPRAHHTVWQCHPVPVLLLERMLNSLSFMLLTVLCVPGLSAKPSKADSCHQGPEVASHIDMSDRLMVSPSLPPLPLSSSSPRYATPRTGTQRTQARQGDFVCVECGKTFHQPSQLRAHLRAHTGITTTLGRVTGQCQVYACLYVGWGMGGRGICSSFIVVP